VEVQPQGTPKIRAPATATVELAALKRVANPYITAMTQADRSVLKRVMLEAGYHQEYAELAIRDRSRAMVRAEQLIVWLGHVPPLKRIDELVAAGLEYLPNDLRQKESIQHLLRAVAAMIETATGGQE
jgi:hypothetical protein